MKTLDITYDEEFYKAENEKSDKVYNAEMEAFQKRVCSHPSCLMRFGRLAERLSTMRCRLWRVCCF